MTLRVSKGRLIDKQHPAAQTPSSLSPNRDELKEDLDDVVAYLLDFVAQHKQSSLAELEQADQRMKSRRLDLFRMQKKKLDEFLSRLTVRETCEPQLACYVAQRVRESLLKAVQNPSLLKRSAKWFLYLESKRIFAEAVTGDFQGQSTSVASANLATVRDLWERPNSKTDADQEWQPSLPGKQCRLRQRLSPPVAATKNRMKPECDPACCAHECDVLFFFEEGFNVELLSKHLDVPAKTLYRFQIECQERVTRLKGDLEQYRRDQAHDH